jgi:hypothetical protein
MPGDEFLLHRANVAAQQELGEYETFQTILSSLSEDFQIKRTDEFAYHMEYVQPVCQMNCAKRFNLPKKEQLAEPKSCTAGKPTGDANRVAILSHR